jgi:hypothetical protein
MGDRKDWTKDERRTTNAPCPPSFILHPSSFVLIHSSRSDRPAHAARRLPQPLRTGDAAVPGLAVGIGALQDYIQEWQSPDFHSLSVQPFAWLLLVTFGVVGASRRRLALTDFLLVAGFAYLGLMAGRNIALFALAAPLALTRHAAPLLESKSRRLGIRPGPQEPFPRQLAALNLLLVGALLLATAYKISLVFPQEANQAAFEKIFPVRAVETLHQRHPPGHLFNSYNWGGYLLWALPEYLRS